MALDYKQSVHRHRISSDSPSTNPWTNRLALLSGLSLTWPVLGRCLHCRGDGAGTLACAHQVFDMLGRGSYTTGNDDVTYRDRWSGACRAWDHRPPAHLEPHA